MLSLSVPARDFYDEVTEEFFYTKECTLQLEHSLVSLSKWESKWHKPFLSTKKTVAETIDYVRCMTITQNVDPNIYLSLGNKHITEVVNYIEGPMTATTFPTESSKATNKEIVTAELIYYWMIAFNIPFECQKWHLNRLITLINVCNIKNQPQKKMNRQEIIQRNKALNAARRQQLNTKG